MDITQGGDHRDSAGEITDITRGEDHIKNTGEIADITRGGDHADEPFASLEEIIHGISNHTDLSERNYTNKQASMMTFAVAWSFKIVTIFKKKLQFFFFFFLSNSVCLCQGILNLVK